MLSLGPVDNRGGGVWAARPIGNPYDRRRIPPTDIVGVSSLFTLHSPLVTALVIGASKTNTVNERWIDEPILPTPFSIRFNNIQGSRR
ncbi:MAG TPA: hypothetical protein VKO18_01760 [Terriglobia bacterium]|nr:hypothetical protein [Terriglobia bacterium]